MTSTGLLLLHAWPMDAAMWAGQIEAVGGRLPVVAPNMPGFGGSPAAGPVTTMGACADRAVESLDAAGVDRAVVCGLSMGGYVAFELWRRSRDRVAGMILANTRAVADTPETVRVRADIAEGLRTEGLEPFLAEFPPLLSEHPATEIRDFVREVVGRQSAEAIAAATVGLGARVDSTSDLSTITVPVAVIASTGDRLIPSDVTLEMAGEIPGAVPTLLNGAGHLSNLEAPAEFSAALADHLTRCGV